MPRKATQYAERTARIIEMTARYENVFAPAVSAVLFGGAEHPCGNVLNSESHDGGPLRAYPRSLPGGMTRWSLSAEGAKRLGLPGSRETQGAVDLDIGILFACVFSQPRHHRLTLAELRHLFRDDAPAPNIPHIVVDGDSPYVLRAYQATRDVRYTIKRLGEIQTVIGKNKTLSAWARDRDYGIACLLPSATALTAFRTAIERTPVLRAIRIDVLLGPTAATLAAELRRRRASHG